MTNGGWFCWRAGTQNRLSHLSDRAVVKRDPYDASEYQNQENEAHPLHVLPSVSVLPRQPPENRTVATHARGRGGCVSADCWRSGCGFQPAMVRTHCHACTLSVTPGNSRLSSTTADSSPLCSNAARIASSLGLGDREHASSASPGQRIRRYAPGRSSRTCRRLRQRPRRAPVARRTTARR